MVQYTAAMILLVAVLCSVALLSQASPVDWSESEFAREEEEEILEDVAARIISELESTMMIQQNGGKAIKYYYNTQPLKSYRPPLALCIRVLCVRSSDPLPNM